MTDAVKKRKKKRLFRFSLTSALLFMSVVSGLLAFWLTLIHPTQMQWNAVRHLVERGVRVETSPSETPDWVKRFLPEGETENIDALFFRKGGPLQPGDLNCLRRLPHLKRLYLERCDVSDGDVAQIGKHRPLEHLALWGNERLSDASVEHLVQLKKLKMLDIRTANIDWRASIEFSKCHDLTVNWEFDYAKVFDANSDEIDALARYFPKEVTQLKLSNDVEGSIAHAVKKFKNLKSIEIDDAPQLTTAEINSLAESISKDGLVITIDDCTNADNAFMDSISECFSPVYFTFSNIRNGCLNARHRSNRHFEILLGKLSPQFVQKFPTHTIFADVPSGTFNSSDESTAYQLAKQFKKLKYLQFSKCKFTSFDAWKGYPELKTIVFKRCDNLASINALSNFESLETLWLSGLQQLDSIQVGKSDAANPNLKSLYLYELPSFRRFSSLSRFDAIKRISIRSCDLLKDISWMSGLKKLREAKVESCSLQQVANLRNLPSLTRLEFKSCDSISKFTDCEFDSITHLIVTNGTKIDNFRCFENVSGLSYFRTDTDLQSCKNTEQLDSLKELHLDGVLKSINGLERLPKLEVLRLGHFKIADDESKQTLAKLAETLTFFCSWSLDTTREFQKHQKRFHETQEAASSIPAKAGTTNKTEH